MAEDASWRGLEEPWQRLRWARAKIFDTAQDAAISMGMRPNTYTAYERSPDSSKHSKLDHQSAISFARKFKVNWEWLLLGNGEPTPSKDQKPTEPMQRALDAMRGASLEQQRVIADAIEALAKASARRR